MPRLNVPALDDAPAGVQRILAGVGAQLGFVPDMFKVIASNPTVLEAVTTLQGTLSRVLDAKTRHSIALAVSEANGCDYCLAIHTYVSSEFGRMSSEDIALGRAGSSVDPKRAAVARFAQRVVESRGRVSDADLAAVRGAGYTDPQILAIVAVAVQALFTNFINNVNETEIDIPAVDSAGAPS
ncbi:carboxymuconolactone decarboxylase family protein [Amycolatopsis sp. FDAARGOS 1241]|uniref:carboxymuconolactone decarboxylase family protein n=1 Tax=Amycolatopsis sp. FDAARGOS 1241 TaxID=2778070 RepID=UPI00194DD842|nr:carboxymuconolactone decarboxylase family protein [Amycolatopsis sp. FDAARGOS 1241]QRP42688.1 carboxymuconolactone decarboxylase family protein [Amycolatopsis sp. FDAARGOS 1241]